MNQLELKKFNTSIELHTLTVLIGSSANASLEDVSEIDNEIFIYRNFERAKNPEEQIEKLYSLLKNIGQTKKTIITTHSPYVLNALTLAIKANVLKEKGLKNFSNIVPYESCISSKDVIIFEINKEVELLSKTNGIPSDDNYLNNLLQKSNGLFDELLSLQDDFEYSDRHDHDCKDYLFPINSSTHSCQKCGEVYNLKNLTKNK